MSAWRFPGSVERREGFRGSLLSRFDIFFDPEAITLAGVRTGYRNENSPTASNFASAPPNDLPVLDLYYLASKQQIHT